MAAEVYEKIDAVNDDLGALIKENGEKDAQATIDFEARLKELETQLLDEITASKAVK